VQVWQKRASNGVTAAGSRWKIRSRRTLGKLMCDEVFQPKVRRYTYLTSLHRIGNTTSYTSSSDSWICMRLG
jgi:hypothetical protein